MAQTLGDALTDLSRPRINRSPSPLLALAMPWLVIALGSLSPYWPLVASAPVVPPLGFMALIAWQQARPGLLPVWAGLPLGLFDDLFSGQPMGSALLLWSLAMIALDTIELRTPWRNFLSTWAVAATMIAAYLVLTLLIATHGAGRTLPTVLIPQLVLSLLLYPLVARLVAAADRLRLVQLRQI